MAAAIKLATPDNEKDLVDDALRLSVTALELAARRAQEVSPKEEREVRRMRELWWRWNAEGTALKYGGT